MLTEYRFEPARLYVAAGESVSVAAVNQGKVNHSLTIVGVRPRIDSGSLNPGSTRIVHFVAPREPGIYRFICTEEDHEDKGMTGEIVVV